MSEFRVNKWMRKQTRKQIEAKREIGTYFRKKENKTWKFKLRKRRRSKRRHLMKSTYDNAFHYITENVPWSWMIPQFNNNPIISPKNYNIVNNSIVLDQDLFITKPKQSFICIACNSYCNKKDVIPINCYKCKQFISQNISHRLQYHICKPCSRSMDIDICRGKRKSLFCTKYTLHKCKCKHTKCFPIKRMNKLFEPLKWEWNDNVYGYNIPAEYIRDTNASVPGKYITINSEYYRVFCTECVDVKQIEQCQYDGCTNKDIYTKFKFKKYCINHRCISCDKYVYSRNYYGVVNEPRKCKHCNHIYCVHMSQYSYSKNQTRSNCGSIISNSCKKCFIMNEENALRDSIYNNVQLYQDISEIIYEYAIGYAFECSNYEKCENEILVESMLYFEIEKMKDYDDNEFYCYKIYKKNMIRKYEEKLIRVNKRYFRAFCKKCICDETLYRCKWNECENNDILIFDFKKCDDNICMNHTIKIAQNHCDLCLTHKTTRNWIKSMVECEFCNKTICDECVENGCHKVYCKSFQLKQFDEDIKTFEDIGGSGFNEDLMDYNFIMDYKERNAINNCNYWNNNNAKKSSRRSTKNKSKMKSYYKRRNDKRANIKYKKRSNKQILLNQYISS